MLAAARWQGRRAGRELQRLLISTARRWQRSQHVTEIQQREFSCVLALGGVAGHVVRSCRSIDYARRSFTGVSSTKVPAAGTAAGDGRQDPALESGKHSSSTNSINPHQSVSSSKASSSSSHDKAPTAEKRQLVATDAYSEVVRKKLEEGKLEAAAGFLGGMVKGGHRPHISLFHRFLKAVAAKCGAKEAWRVLALMRQSGTQPDVMAYNLALRSQTTLQSADLLLKEMVDAGVAPDRGTYTAMLRACRVSRDMPRALELFAQMEATDPSFADTPAWNLLLHAIIASGNPQSALRKATEMTQRGAAPNAVTFSLLLAAHAARGDQAKVDSLVSQMSASGVEIAPAYYRWVIEGYAQGGLMQRAEDALEATLTSGIFKLNMAVSLLWNYSNAGNLPRVEYWLRRLSASGHKPTLTMWSAAINTAHQAGDTDTADALWRDAEAAGGMGTMYKEMRRVRGGGGWHMVRDQPARSRDAGSTVLDLTICGVGVALAALRAEAHDLRNKSPSAFRYVFMGTRMPLNVKNEVMDGMHELGLQVSEVPGAAYFYKIAVLASQRQG